MSVCLPGPVSRPLLPLTPPPVPPPSSLWVGAQREKQTAMAFWLWHFLPRGKLLQRSRKGLSSGGERREEMQGSRLLRAGAGLGKGGPSSWESPPPDNSSSWGLAPPLNNLQYAILATHYALNQFSTLGVSTVCQTLCK